MSANELPSGHGSPSTSRRIAALALGALVLAGGAIAQSLDVEPRVALSTAAAWNPRAAAGALEGFMVAWLGPEGIELRALDANGQPLAPTQLLPASGEIHQWTAPQVAALPDGRYAIVWADEIEVVYPRPRRWVERLIVQLVDGQGSPVGDPLAVHPESMNERWIPAVAATSDGTLIVAWTGARRVHAVRIATAPALRQVSPVLDLGPGVRPRVTALPGGAFAAAWLRLPHSWTEPDQVVLRTFGADDTPREEELLITSTEPRRSALHEDFVDIRVSSDVAGRMLLLWQEKAGDRLRAQRFAAGLRVGNEIGLAEGAPRRELGLGELATRADGTHLVSWTLGPPIGGGCWGFCVPPADRYFELRVAIIGADGGASAAVLIATSDREVVEEAKGAAAGSQGWILLEQRWRFDEVRPGDGVGARHVRLASACDRSGGLCLADRFHFAVDDFVSTGNALVLTGDSGAFWFFSPGNLELVAKVVDGTAVNGHHWVFFASLTDVEFELVVTDTLTGVERRYANPRGTMASRADVAAFPVQAANGASRELASLDSAAQERPPVARTLRADPRAGDEESARKARATGGALEDSTASEPTAVSLAADRFTATVDWRLRDGTAGTATAVPLSDDTGLFWFFSPQNLEVAVKVLDGTAVNGHHWVFYASLTDVEFDLTVVDTLTGEQLIYRNPPGTMASRADVEAFP
jgi:hypothetical protein